jgi:hypothetical protein
MLRKRPTIVRSFSYSERVPASAARRHLPARPHAVILARPRRCGAAHAARERCAGGGGRPGEMSVVLRNKQRQRGNGAGGAAARTIEYSQIRLGACAPPGDG